MFSRNLVPLWIVAAAGVFAAVSFSAPAPKETKDPKAKASEHEEAAEPVEMNLLSARKLRNKSSNNLKQMALAVHNYASANQDMLPQNIVDKNGKALLSWRVHLLPFIEQQQLWNQFKLDEPWDSANNLKLLEQMPEVYASPRVKVKKKGYTTYLGFEGNGAIFGSKYSIGNIPDGTSNTILCVESSVAVPWTKPVDLPFDPKKDVPDFGKAYDGKPIVAICDGSVRVLDMKKLSAKTLKNAIIADDGNPLGDDW
jgi:hypothetical protein